MNADAWKKRLLLHLPYGVIGLAAAKLSEAWRLSAGTDFSREIPAPAGWRGNGVPKRTVRLCAP